MINVLYSLLGFIVAIGLLTVIHEYGHFWVARRLGVKVLRFSVGFGKVLFSKFDKSGTEYAICAIPLGGYVKMLDQNEGIVAPQDLPRAYNTKPVWVRMAIIAAGPLFNMLFAILAYWIVFMSGITSLVPILGDVPVGTAAYNAGLHSGQEITAVDNRGTPTWEDVVMALVSHSGDHDFASITVKDIKDQTVSAHSLNLNNWSLDNNEQNLLEELGFIPYDPIKPIIGNTMPDYPAAKADLKAGDLIVALNNTPVNNVSQLLDLIRDKYDQPINLQVLRDDKTVNVTLVPVKKVLENGVASGFIGVQFKPQTLPANYIRVQRYNPLTALDKAFERTKEYSVLTLHFLYKMVTGKMSLDHISGPIAIAQYAGVTARTGIESFLGFLALISISLGLLNMLPIPVLDGGHFLFCCIEAIRGKALSARAMNVGFAFGFVLLGSVMLLAIYNDVLRLIN